VEIRDVKIPPGLEDAMRRQAQSKKGSIVIVPSSAVETMGLGGLSGLTALGRSDLGLWTLDPGL
jgi:hypothetical protein